MKHFQTLFLSLEKKVFIIDTLILITIDIVGAGSRFAPRLTSGEWSRHGVHIPQPDPLLPS